MRFGRQAAAVALGVALIAGTPVAWQVTRPPATVGEVPAPAPQPEEPDVVPTGGPAGSAPPVVTTGAVEVRSGTLEDSGLIATPAPARLRIPAIGVDAEVVPVGQSEPGVMEVPSDVSTVGWYEPGVTPGRNGSAVLAGHVDSRTQGAGAFFDLRRLDVDDTIEIIDADGGVQRWIVVARTTFPKDELVDQRLFARDGDPRLVLVTCGGPFDAGSSSYRDNVVVHAVPA